MSTTQRRGMGTATAGGATALHEWFRVTSPDANIGYHNSVYFGDGDPDKTLFLSGHIGPGFTPTTVTLIVVPTATGNIRWSGNYDFGAEGTETYNNTTGAIVATTTAVVINVLTRVNLPIAGLAPTDILGIEFTADLDNVLNEVSYHVLGVSIQ